MLISFMTAVTQVLVTVGIGFGVYTDIVEPTALAAYETGTELYQEYVVGTEAD